MLKFIFSILLMVSIGKPVEAHFFEFEQHSTAVFVAGLLIKNTFMYYSKPSSTSHAVRFVILRSLSDGTALFLIKEASESLLQSFGNIAPDWLKPKRNSRLEAENTRLRQQLEDFKTGAIATDSIIQSDRINLLKAQILSSKLEIMFSKIDDFLRCSIGILCADKSLEIANILTDFIEQILNLYPGFTDGDLSFIAVPNWKPSKTGESYIYNETIILDKAQKFHLKNRIPHKTIVYLEETLNQFLKRKDRPKAEYYQHFLDLLGINIELSELETKFNGKAQSI